MKTGTLIALAAAAALAGSAVAAWAQTLQLPGGSYRVTCNDARAWRGQGGERILSARCRMANGAWRQTSLRYGGCRGDIANINGNLTCKTGPAPGYGGGGDTRPLPPGALTLYSQPGYRGASVTLRGPTPTLAPWRFGDKTKSLQVRGRGRWQVCTLINYRGRCEVVGDSVYDLGGWRLSNQISSARPYR
jgi:hypothetical protein